MKKQKESTLKQERIIISQQKELCYLLRENSILKQRLNKLRENIESLHKLFYQGEKGRNWE